MQNQKEVKLFAFKLAGNQQQDAKPAPQWKVRDGVASAGCTDTGIDGEWKMATTWGGPDSGIYC
jgi:hypothetical protein